MNEQKRNTLKKAPEGYVRLVDRYLLHSDEYDALSGRLYNQHYAKWEQNSGLKASVLVKEEEGQRVFVHPEVLKDFESTYQRTCEHFKSQSGIAISELYNNLKKPENIEQNLSVLEEYLNHLVNERLQEQKVKIRPYLQQQIREAVTDKAMDVLLEEPYKNEHSFRGSIHQFADGIVKNLLEKTEVSTVDPDAMTRWIDPRAVQPVSEIDDPTQKLEAAIAKLSQKQGADFKAVVIDEKPLRAVAEASESTRAFQAVGNNVVRACKNLRVDPYIKSLQEAAAAANAPAKGRVRQVFH